MWYAWLCAAPAGGRPRPQLGFSVGGGVVGGWVVGGAVVGPPPGVVGVPVDAPVQVVPLSAKLVGAGLLPFHDPLKPNDAVPLAARLPL
jgi:hypothetical protein